MSAPIATLAAIRAFLLAGNAVFTLVSKKTGSRKTFRVEATDDHRSVEHMLGADADEVSPPTRFFVSLLVGPENTTDYRYSCFLYETRVPGIYAVKQNKTNWAPEAFVAFSWLVRLLNAWYADRKTERGAELENHFFKQVELWHVGACGRCGRTLTTPESIALGLGPVCAEKGMPFPAAGDPRD